MAFHKKISRRKPSPPGIILDEHYIKPLNLNLQKLADHLESIHKPCFCFLDSFCDLSYRTSHPCVNTWPRRPND